MQYNKVYGRCRAIWLTLACLMMNVLRIFCAILRMVRDNQMHLKDEDAVVVVVVFVVVVVVVVFSGRKLCLVCEFGGSLMSPKVTI